MKQRLLPFLLALLLTLTVVLGGCTPKTEEPSTTTDVTATEPSDTTTTPDTSVTTDTGDTSVTETPADATTVETPAATTETTPTPTTKPAPAKSKPAKTTTKPAPTKPAPVVTKPAETTTEPAQTEPAAEEEQYTLPQATDSNSVTIAPDKVLNLNTDKGLFTIRYFLLQADKKSGDSILIHTPADKFYLIDAGEVACGTQVVKYLKDLGVTKLDAVFNTHPHSDHLGGMPDVINSFPIGMFYHNERVYDSSMYRNEISSLESNNIPQQILYEGDELDLGDGVTVHVYNPPKGMDPEVEYPSYTDAGKTNQQSLALMFTYKDVKMFFIGDMYILGEQNMIARYPDGTFDADIVHAGHHGASTSSSNDYLLATDPAFVIMSTNGLQSIDTYTKYALYGSVVVANSLNGNILITNDGTKESIHSYIEHQSRPEDGKAAPEN